MIETQKLFNSLIFKGAKMSESGNIGDIAYIKLIIENENYTFYFNTNGEMLKRYSKNNVITE